MAKTPQQIIAETEAGCDGSLCKEWLKEWAKDQHPMLVCQVIEFISKMDVDVYSTENVDYVFDRLKEHLGER